MIETKKEIKDILNMLDTTEIPQHVAEATIWCELYQIRSIFNLYDKTCVFDIHNSFWEEACRLSEYFNNSGEVAARNVADYLSSYNGDLHRSVAK